MHTMYRMYRTVQNTRYWGTRYNGLISIRVTRIQWYTVKHSDTRVQEHRVTRAH